MSPNQAVFATSPDSTKPQFSALTDAARTWHQHETPDSAWSSIVDVASDQLPGVAYAAITAMVRKRPTTVAASADAATKVDHLQYLEQEGPCLEAVAGEPSVWTADLHSESRWPRFTARASAETDMRSVLSLRLYAQDETFGALNLYAEQPNAFGAETTSAAAVLVTLAGFALARVSAMDKVQNLRTALDSNRKIGAAVGILMSQHRVTEDAAFDLLRAVSQHSNRKLRDIADDVVHTGALPTLA